MKTMLILSAMASAFALPGGGDVPVATPGQAAPVATSATTQDPAIATTATARPRRPGDDSVPAQPPRARRRAAANGLPPVATPVVSGQAMAATAPIAPVTTDSAITGIAPPAAVAVLPGVSANTFENQDPAAPPAQAWAGTTSDPLSGQGVATRVGSRGGAAVAAPLPAPGGGLGGATIAAPAQQAPGVGAGPMSPEELSELRRLGYISPRGARAGGMGGGRRGSVSAGVGVAGGGGGVGVGSSSAPRGAAGMGGVVTAGPMPPRGAGTFGQQPGLAAGEPSASELLDMIEDLRAEVQSLRAEVKSLRKKLGRSL
jgi:translation initiation factor IF-2